MKKKSTLFIHCDESNSICDKTQYNEATFWEKFKLSIHLIYCKFCRMYTKKNSKLTKIMKSPELEYLEASEKNALKNSFEKELSKQN